MARNTLTKKDLKELRKVVGDSPGGKRTVLLLAGLTALVLLAIGAFSFLVTAGGASNKNFTSNAKGLLPVGSQAPDFSAESVGGDQVSLNDSGDYSATMLVFFASWCPHCNKEAPLISDLENQYPNLRTLMVGIDGRDDTDKVREFINNHNIRGPAIYDPSLGPAYRATGYPTIYLLDGSGKIVAANSGEVPRDVLEGWIQEALGSGE